MTRARLISWGTVAIAIFAFLWVIRSERMVGEDQAIIMQARAALAQGNAYRTRLAKLSQLAQLQADSARRWQRLAQDRGMAVTRLDDALAASRSQAESLGVVLIQRDTLKTQVVFWQAAASKWERAFRVDSTRADVAEARITALERSLTATLTVADCHWLGAKWLPRCLSRNTAAVVGLVGGLALSRIR